MKKILKIFCFTFYRVDQGAQKTPFGGILIYVDFSQNYYVIPLYFNEIFEFNIPFCIILEIFVLKKKIQHFEKYYQSSKNSQKLEFLHFNYNLFNGKLILTYYNPLVKQKQLSLLSSNVKYCIQHCDILHIVGFHMDSVGQLNCIRIHHDMGTIVIIPHVWLYLLFFFYISEKHRNIYRIFFGKIFIPIILSDVKSFLTRINCNANVSVGAYTHTCICTDHESSMCIYRTRLVAIKPKAT